ncbi:hypothetical protein OS493_025118 [Desmophyllum pertusum]|uniref:Uncharacterized protein n=1 Tax=Desmophyllum pertusum TaxID=174260 RepID=A0A9X0D9Z6_9CNID|nr:hypothetical protein OS493_025118 [Desmophyllum pertusum]
MNVTTGAPRSRTASDSDSDRYIRKASSKLSSNSSTKTSDPNLARRSSYFSLQSLRRSISLDAGSAARRLSKRASRDEKAEWRFGHGFKGIVTAIDEEEQEERRQLALARFRRAVHLIRIFSSLCLSIRRYADQDKSRQYDFYYIRDMLPGDDDKPTSDKTDMPVTFNKHLFFQG